VSGSTLGVLWIRRRLPLRTRYNWTTLSPSRTQQRRPLAVLGRADTCLIGGSVYEAAAMACQRTACHAALWTGGAHAMADKDGSGVAHPRLGGDKQGTRRTRVRAYQARPRVSCRATWAFMRV
jgi:hypothetical protein